MHEAASLCPACGAPATDSAAQRCETCGAARRPPAEFDLDTIELEQSATLALCCPGCGEPMSSWAIDPRITDGTGGSYRASEIHTHGCRSCGGAWVDRRTLDEMILRAKSKAAFVDFNSVQRRTMSMSAAIIYRSCPCCRLQMNRRNFARYSGVVVDECRTCGTYFDAGELEHVFAFVHSGGLALRERLEPAAGSRERAPTMVDVQLRAAATPSYAEFDVLVWFLRWLGRWLRRARR